MWLPYGPGYLQSFIQSYRQYPAGAGHQLMILFNGVKQEEELAPYRRLLEQHQVQYRELIVEDGQDIEAYYHAAQQCEDGKILFLNTYSEFRSASWLKKYQDAFITDDIALVGATGSWLSYYSSVYSKYPFRWEREKGWRYNYRKYKLFIKAFLYWSFLFRAFPNPHIRTNAFMIPRHLFLQLKQQSVKTKFQAYVFESGRSGMTGQLLKKGKTVLVVDKDGKTYTQDRWKQSNTLWNGDQENLLVSDNQTDLYQAARQEERTALTALAWEGPSKTGRRSHRSMILNVDE